MNLSGYLITMQTLYKRFSVLAGFVVLLIVLAASSAVTRRQLGVQAEDRDWLAHSGEVLLEIERTESLLKDAETGQRGFLFTGDPKYLAPYTNAVAQVRSQINTLADSTKDNPRQQARIKTLHRLSTEKLNELKQTISLFQS